MEITKFSTLGSISDYMLYRICALHKDIRNFVVGWSKSQYTGRLYIYTYTHAETSDKIIQLYS